MKVCCILGHRDFEKNDDLALKVRSTIIYLIEKENTTIFLFGSKSKFSDFCYDIITNLRNKYLDIKRIFIRAEFPIISDDYYTYLKGFYEDSYFYSEKLMCNKFGYIKRNQLMIDKSDFCIFYFDSNYDTKIRTRSGTHMAYEYAIKKNKTIFNLCP